jgi:hypothetical protein
MYLQCAHIDLYSFVAERERERDGVLTSSNGYLNHEVAKKVAHVAGFGEDRVTELRSLLGKVDGDALRIVGIGASAWGSVFIALLQDAYGALRDSVQVGKHISHSPAFVLFSLCLCMCLSVCVGTQRCIYFVNLYYVVTVNKASWLEMVHSANRSSRKRQCLWMHIFQQCASEFETILLRRLCKSYVEIVRSDQISRRKIDNKMLLCIIYMYLMTNWWR